MFGDDKLPNLRVIDSTNGQTFTDEAVNDYSQSFQLMAWVAAGGRPQH